MAAKVGTVFFLGTNHARAKRWDERSFACRAANTRVEPTNVSSLG